VGKKFGTEESGAFINGILDSIRVALDKKVIEINGIEQSDRINSL